MMKGSQPTDAGNFLFSTPEKDQFVAKEKASQVFFRPFVGSEEFINHKERWCLWLLKASPAELRSMPLVMKRINNVRETRLKSPKAGTRKKAETPHLFDEIRQPQQGNYLLVPSVSSEKRWYVPIGFMDYETIASNLVLIIPSATLYHFGVLTSLVHNAWMRVVCGRLEMRYRYSKDVVYNNFPWPEAMEEQRKRIEETAQGILDARAKYPDSSLADLYDPLVMPAALRKAHHDNDHAVMDAYGYPRDLAESDIVADLFQRYRKLC